MADDHLTPDDLAWIGSHVDCIAGALTNATYRHYLTDAGFTDIKLSRSHAVAIGLHSNIIQATKPASGLVEACHESRPDPTTTVTRHSPRPAPGKPSSD